MRSIRLDAVEGSARLPYSLKILLENLLRTEDGANVTADHIRALGQLGPDGRAERGDPVHPGPGDHAGLHRRALRRRPRHHARGHARPRRRPGEDQPARPGRAGHRPLGRSSTSSAAPDAFQRNVEREYERNRERYQFLRWGQNAFDEFKVVPPGTGIVHQVNIEHLARVVMTRGRQGVPRHLRRHRLPHHDGERPRRARLGRRRHRGRGRHARPADLDADPAGGRLQAHRQAARRRHRHRPGAHRSPRCCASTAWSASSSSSTARASPRCRWPTGPRSAT